MYEYVLQPQRTCGTSATGSGPYTRHKVALQVKVGSKTYKSKPTTVKIKVNIK